MPGDTLRYGRPSAARTAAAGPWRKPRGSRRSTVHQLESSQPPVPEAEALQALHRLDPRRPCQLLQPRLVLRPRRPTRTIARMAASSVVESTLTSRHVTVTLAPTLETVYCPGIRGIFIPLEGRNSPWLASRLVHTRRAGICGIGFPGSDRCLGLPLWPEINVESARSLTTIGPCPRQGHGHRSPRRDHDADVSRSSTKT